MKACLAGDERAWSALLDKYKNLIFSVPLKYRLSREDAADIFQAVALELFSGLPKLRDVEALRAWLIAVAAHRSIAYKRRQQVRDLREGTSLEESLERPDSRPSFADELEREQSVREAVALLPPRCRELIHLLFFEPTTPPYKDVAARLGLAPGSIGFVRGRCLGKLRKNLQRKL
ncbi:MAG TPA: sigma-70 family RNA polymerase sigma factor [Thermoanaerobaculia bacterium]|nr:sigma-70 family RNA polymerase sigma factor [Thermoanaerobaculia bacterium]